MRYGAVGWAAVVLVAVAGRPAGAEGPATGPATGPAKRPAAGGRVRVACVGDSITEGFTIEHPDRDGYPADLGRLLGGRYDVRNFGAGGCTCLRHGDRPYVTDPRHFYDRATAFDPDVVVIMLGTNDSKPANFAHADEFAADLTALVDHFRDGPAHPAVYLCLPPPAVTGAYGISDANLDHLIPTIRRVAADRHATVVDVHAALAGDPAGFSDGIHPNAAGAAKVAEAVAAAVRGG